MYQPDAETFGVTLPTPTWRALIELAMRADRQPSDYLRTLIQREADNIKAPAAPQLGEARQA